MQRYRMETVTFVDDNGLPSASSTVGATVIVLARPSETGAWVKSDEAVTLEAERDAALAGMELAQRDLSLVAQQRDVLIDKQEATGHLYPSPWRERAEKAEGRVKELEAAAARDGLEYSCAAVARRHQYAAQDNGNCAAWLESRLKRLAELEAGLRANGAKFMKSLGLAG